MGEAVVPRVVRASVLALVLLAPVGLSGCLADDIWREPFVWRPAAEMGEGREGAQALAGALADLGAQGTGGSDQVVSTAEDLPDGAVFQNAKEFLDRQSPGTGSQAEDGVRVVVDNATGAYVTLTGQAAQAYRDSLAAAVGGEGPATFDVPDRTTRLRWNLDVIITGAQSEEPGQNPTPAQAFDVRITSPYGVVAEYHIDTTRQVRDQVVQGTWGDRNEVRRDLAGTWTVEVTGAAQGSWSLAAEAYQPEFDDWRMWQFWRADSRVAGA